jgi:hypothetical protein
MGGAAFIRKGDGMYPLDDDGLEMVRAVQQGKAVMGEFKGARNPRQHRLFFALLKILVDNTPTEWFMGDTEQARRAILTDTREFTLWVHPITGEVRQELNSMKYGSMTQEHFNRFFNRALYIICNDYLKGADMETVRQEVYAAVDGERSASLGPRIERAA